RAARGGAVAAVGQPRLRAEDPRLPGDGGVPAEPGGGGAAGPRGRDRLTGAASGTASGTASGAGVGAASGGLGATWSDRPTPDRADHVDVVHRLAQPDELLAHLGDVGDGKLAALAGAGVPAERTPLAPHGEVVFGGEDGDAGFVPDREPVHAALDEQRAQDLRGLRLADGRAGVTAAARDAGPRVRQGEPGGLAAEGGRAEPGARGVVPPPSPGEDVDDLQSAAVLAHPAGRLRG